MSKLLKNVLCDIFIVWPLIYFGLFLHIDYVYNIALALMWCASVSGIFLMPVVICSKDLRIKLASERKNKKLWIHKKYQIVTSIAEVTAVFALGYFWLGGFYLAAQVFTWIAYQAIEEEIK